MVNRKSLQMLRKEIVSKNKRKGVNRGSRNNKKTPRTFSQVRKHISQMSKDEVNKCVEMLELFKNNLKMSTHLLKRKSINFDIDDVVDKLNGSNKALKKSLVEYSERYLHGVWKQRITLLVANKEVYFDDDDKASKGHLEVCFDISHRTLLTGYFREGDDDPRKPENIDLDVYNPEIEIRDFKKGGYLFSNNGLGKELKDFYDSVYKDNKGYDLSKKISGISSTKKGEMELKKEGYLKQYVKTGYNGLDYKCLNLVEEIDLTKEIINKIEVNYGYPIKVDIEVQDTRSKHKDIYITDNENGYSNIRKNVVKDFKSVHFGRRFYFGTEVNGNYKLNYIIKGNEEDDFYNKNDKKEKKEGGVKSIRVEYVSNKEIEVYESLSNVYKKYNFSNREKLESRIPKIIDNFEVHTNGEIYTFKDGEKLRCKEFDENNEIKVIGYNKNNEEIINSKGKLLATAFIQNSNNLEYVGYLDNDYKNLRLSNLRWVTLKTLYKMERKNMLYVSDSPECEECEISRWSVKITKYDICKNCYKEFKKNNKEKLRKYIQRHEIKESVSHIPLDELTIKQREKILLRKEGKVYKEIAEELGITYQVVGYSILNILKKYPKQSVSN